MAVSIVEDVPVLRGKKRKIEESSWKRNLKKENTRKDIEDINHIMADIPNVIPLLGKPAPKFSGKALHKNKFVDIKLEDYAGKYVVLFFYPMDFTFVCPTEIIAFSDRSDEFDELNTQIIACSTDTVYCHFAWTQQPRKTGGLGDIKIPMLSDPTHAVARSYGILKEDEGVAYRGLYIIDKVGTLRQMTLNDMPVGRSVDEVKRLIEAFQFTDEHGEVCPANWKRGDKGIKTDH